MPHSGGRPTLLTPDRRGAICEAISGGASLPQAARLVGIVPRTAQDWIYRGRMRGEEPYAGFARAVREAEEVAAQATREAGEHQTGWPLPETREALNCWFEEAVGYRLPERAVCEGHDAPLDFVWDLFSHRVDDAIVLASRAGGKTLDLALLHIANAALKPGHHTSHFGATADQAQRAYDHYLAGVRGEALRPLAPEPLKSKTDWVHGSRTEIAPATEKRTQGGHPHLVSFDELDSLGSRQAFENSRAMPVEFVDAEGQAHPGQYVITSTRVLRQGPMQQALDAAPTTGAQIYQWCVFETLRACELPDDSPLAEYAQGLDLTQADGWRSLADVTTTFQRMGRDTFEAQMLNRRPEPASLIYNNFSPANVSAEAEWRPGEGQLQIGADWGYNDPTHILLVQLRDRIFYVFDELVGSGQPERYWVRQTLRRVAQLDGYDGPTFAEWEEIWDGRRRSQSLPEVWPTAVNDTTAGHLTREWEQHDVWTEPAADVKHGVLEGQDVLRSALNTEGEIRIKISPRCAALIRGLENYQAETLPDGSYGERPSPSPANHAFSHGPDALRYLVYAHREVLDNEGGVHWVVR